MESNHTVTTVVYSTPYRGCVQPRCATKSLKGNALLTCLPQFLPENWDDSPRFLDTGFVRHMGSGVSKQGRKMSDPTQEELQRLR